MSKAKEVSAWAHVNKPAFFMNTIGLDSAKLIPVAKATATSSLRTFKTGITNSKGPKKFFKIESGTPTA